MVGVCFFVSNLADLKLIGIKVNQQIIDRFIVYIYIEREREREGCIGVQRMCRVY